jgi:hypothetical protein
MDALKRVNFKAFLAFVLVLQLALPFSTPQLSHAASGTIKEDLIHEFGQNTWAYSNLFNSPSGDLYLSHVKNSTEISVKLPLLRQRLRVILIFTVSRTSLLRQTVMYIWPFRMKRVHG